MLRQGKSKSAQKPVKSATKVKPLTQNKKKLTTRAKNVPQTKPLKPAFPITIPSFSLTTRPTAAAPPQTFLLPKSKPLTTPEAFLSETKALFGLYNFSLKPQKTPKRHFSSQTVPTQPPIPEPVKAPAAPEISAPETAPESQPVPETAPVEEKSETAQAQAETQPQESSETQSTDTTDPTKPKYTQFRRVLPKVKRNFTPTESYTDENGDECLVIYEADEETIAHHLRERTRALASGLLLSPACIAGAYFALPQPWCGIMMGAAMLSMLIQFGRVFAVHSFATKITAVWPQEPNPDIANKMRSNLHEAYFGLTPLEGEESSESEHETEFQARQRHYATIAKQRQEEYEADMKAKAAAEKADGAEFNDNETQVGENKANVAGTDATTDKTQKSPEGETQNGDSAEGKEDKGTTEKKNRTPLPRFPQPGVDPMGRVFSFNLNAPDTITWNFGWSDATQRSMKEDVKMGTWPLFERASFADQVRDWTDLPDPDFPEYLYVDRLNDGKIPVYSKVPITNLAAVWSAPIVPPAIPQVTPKFIDQMMTRPHDQAIVMVRMDDKPTGIFPKFIKHDVALNQAIFAANINARSESKAKFEPVRGKMKL